MTVTALIANHTSRHYVVGLIANIYVWLLNVCFGDSDIQTLGLDSVEPTDTADYADGVYQAYFNGYSTIEWFSGSKVRNLLAYGYTVAYVV